jgi:hypothetical protein
MSAGKPCSSYFDVFGYIGASNLICTLRVFSKEEIGLKSSIRGKRFVQAHSISLRTNYSRMRVLSKKIYFQEIGSFRVPSSRLLGYHSESGA